MKFQNIKKKKKRSNLISPLQILKNITVCLTLQNLKMLSQYQKIQLQALMTSITRCLNTFPKPPLTHFYIFQRYMDNRGFSRKLAFGHNYTYSQTRERSCRTNKLQTNSANKLPLQNTRENDKQTTCLVLRI